jgi:hypothetical protein
MALPKADQNIVGCQVSNQDLALTIASSANVTSQNSNTMADNAPRTIIVLASIVSGTLVLNGKIGTGTISNPGSSPTATYTLSASSLSGFIKFDTTASNLNYAIGLTSTSANVTNFAVLDLGKLSVGEDWVSIAAGQNAYASAITGDGSGAFPISV